MNLDFIFDIVAEGKCPDWDKECIIAGAIKSIDTFFLGKDQEYKIQGVELNGGDPAPYKIDIYMTKEGEHKAIDWKYKKRPDKLDDFWRLRESRSWQPKIYAAALATRYGPEIFPLTYEVRGIGSDSDDPAKVKIELISMRLTRQYAVKAVNYLRQVAAERQALIDLGKWPWVMNPDGCQCFGPMYACAFERFCWDGDQPDVDITQLKTLRPLSHSSVKEYIRCPQRYALLQLLGKPEKDDEITAAGILFHQVMESVYKTRISESVSII